MATLIERLGRNARQAASQIWAVDPVQIENALLSAASGLENNLSVILDANARDLANPAITGLSAALHDRLMLNSDRISAMAKGIRVVAGLENPIGRVLSKTVRPNGLEISRRSVPLGVLGIIYESRPNVTADAIALSAKSMNCCILRGGSESLHSSLAIFHQFEKAFAANDLPHGFINFVDDVDRNHVGDMLKADDYIDVIVPRGGKGLTARVMSEARMPVFAHLDGICHVFIDRSADPSMARDVVLNAKMRRTGICGAAETLLVDKNFSTDSLRAVLDVLMNAGCEILGDASVQKLDTRILPASEQDWSTEYLDAKITVAIVADIDAAIDHINSFGSHHTDAIIARDAGAVDRFFNRVESAIVIHNASTQFADGGEFGMGAEIGISTGRFHARGPVGVEQLTTYKYIIEGHGQTRA